MIKIHYAYLYLSNSFICFYIHRVNVSMMKKHQISAMFARSAGEYPLILSAYNSQEEYVMKISRRKFVKGVGSGAVLVG